MSAPRSASSSRISSGASGCRPGWTDIAAPVSSLGDCRRRQGLPLVRRQGPRAADLSDYARPYAAALYAIDDVADDLPRKVLLGALVHVFRMDRVHVEAGAHDYVNARPTGYPRQCILIAADLLRGRVHDCSAANVPVLPELPDGRIHVHELQVGAVAVVVAPYPSKILQGYGRIRQIRTRRVLGRAVHEREVDVEVLVGGGRTQLRWMYGPQHGLDQAPMAA